MTVENVAHKMPTVLQRQGQGCRKWIWIRRTYESNEVPEIVCKRNRIDVKSISRVKIIIIYWINYVLWYVTLSDDSKKSKMHSSSNCVRYEQCNDFGHQHQQISQWSTYIVCTFSQKKNKWMFESYPRAQEQYDLGATGRDGRGRIWDLAHQAVGGPDSCSKVDTRQGILFISEK